MATILTEEELTTQAKNIFATSKQLREEQIDGEWVRENDMYDGNFPAGNATHSLVLRKQKKLFINKTYATVQRVLTEVLETRFLDPEEIVDVTSWGDTPKLDATTVKTLLNYRLNNHPIPFYQLAYEACMDGVRNKVGIFKVFPDWEYEGGKKKPKTYVPQMDCVPMEDIFFDRMSTWITYHKHPIIHRMPRTLDELKRRGYKNLEELATFSSNPSGDRVKTQREKDQGTQGQTNKDIKNQEQLYIFEFWDFLPLVEDGPLKSVSYIMAGSINGPETVIRDVEENKLPYKRLGDFYNRPPIIMGSAYPESHKLYGKSLPIISEDLQKEINAVRNGKREAAAMALRPSTMVARPAGVDVVSLMNRRAGGIVMADDVSQSSIRELESRPNIGAAVEEETANRLDYEDITSITSKQLGASTKGETATGVISADANANKKISMTIRNLNYTLFIPAFDMLLRLEQQYADEEFVRKVTGNIVDWGNEEDGRPAKEIISGDFDFKASLGVNKQSQINKLMLAIERGNLVNVSTIQGLQAGIITPEQAIIINTPKIFLDNVLRLVDIKNSFEYRIKPQIPPPAEGAGGIGSPPSASAPVSDAQLGGA